jgi:hypothetical protein
VSVSKASSDEEEEEEEHSEDDGSDGEYVEKGRKKVKKN